jgi:hypothetical protein
MTDRPNNPDSQRSGTSDSAARPPAPSAVARPASSAARPGVPGTPTTPTTRQHPGAPSGGQPRPASSVGRPVARAPDVPQPPKSSDSASRPESGLEDRGNLRADNAANGVRLRAQLAGQQLSEGHAYKDHRKQFPDVKSRQDFAKKAEDVIANGERRELNGDRTAYWKDDTVAIRNPHAPDGGSMYKPKSGYRYFTDNLE